jgi:hypothetical protein
MKRKGYVSAKAFAELMKSAQDALAFERGY